MPLTATPAVYIAFSVSVYVFYRMTPFTYRFFSVQLAFCKNILYRTTAIYVRNKVTYTAITTGVTIRKMILSYFFDDDFMFLCMSNLKTVIPTISPPSPKWLFK